MAGVDSTAALSALLSSSAAPQAITVNQRALIDKILARYAAEWTVFRELLQNADDAGATECHLRFESKQYHEYKQRKALAAAPSHSDNPTAASATADGEPAGGADTSFATAHGAPNEPPQLDLDAKLHSWAFANDGMPFRTEDWARLRRIAEGNPDPERIGAFGVGYYSVFSICENPMVSSGGEIMGFFWDNDSLFTRHAPVPTPPSSSAQDGSADAGSSKPKKGSLREDRWTAPAPAPELSCAERPWTTFMMPLREPAPLPDHPLNLARFLATSLTFTARIRRVALHWDDRVLCEFEKSVNGQPPMQAGGGSAVTTLASPNRNELAVPSNLNAISPGRMLRLESLSSSRVQITALHHPLLLASAMATELEARRKRAKAAEQAQKSGLSAGAAAVAGLFNIGSSSTSSGSESKRSAFSSFFGLGKKSTPAPAPVLAPIPTPRPPVPAPAPVHPEESFIVLALRDAKPVTTVVHFRIATAHLNVVADAAFIKEIERSTKKPPPARTAFSVVFADRDEVKRSGGEEDVFTTSANSAAKKKEEEKTKKIAVSLSKTDERRLTNRHLFGTLLPWLSGAGSGDDGVGDAVAKQSGRRGNISDDDAVTQMAREQQGHVFIGFRTHQTTGFAGHLAARFIPTVERESLDFIDKYCREWNEELLSMGGYLIRALYEHEMTLLGQLWDKEFKANSNRPADDDVKGQEIAEDLFDRALHLLRFFTIRTSHPSGKVAEILQNRFFAVSTEGRAESSRMLKFMQSSPSEADKAVRIMSTCGVWPSSRVRLPNEVLNPFIKQLPMLPAAHITKAADFIRACTTRGLLMEVQMPDVFKELSDRPLNVEEMKACLKWFIMVATHPDYNPSLRAKLFETAVLTLPPAPRADADKDASPAQDLALRIQPLGEVATYLNSQRIPTGFPYPPSCLAYEVSKSFQPEELSNIFDWRELSVAQWVSHLVALSATSTSNVPASDEENIQLSPAFSERVFVVLARAWGNISAGQQAEITKSLQDIPCIPTRSGMQKPQQAYFPSVSLFDDLPIVTFPSGNAIVKGNLEKVLAALGIRKHVELQMIFTRLLAAGDWSHVELVGYLANNQGTLSVEERDRLKKTSMFPREGEEPQTDAEGKPKVKRHRANQLYEPLPALRALGLPLLDWTKTAVAQKGALGNTADEGRPTAQRTWRANSEEAKFLFDTLGLKRHPPLSTLLEKASDPTTTKEVVAMRTKALVYLREKWDAVYAAQYNFQDACQYAFVPCLPSTSDGSALSKEEKEASSATNLRNLEQAYTNPKAALLGFDVVDSSLFTTIDVARFKVRENPDPNALITRLLRSPTKDKVRAQQIFEYFASVSTFGSNHYQFLRDKNFIPVARPAKDPKGNVKDEITLVAPIVAFFGSSRVASLSYKDVFLFVDFGEKAGYFLRNCGVTDEPTIEEVAAKLVRDPRNFYTLAGSSDNYLDILRQIATNWRRVPKRTRDEMRDSAFLLGSKRESRRANDGAKRESGQDGIPNIMDEEEDEEQGLLTYDLLRPAQVVIVDDASAHMIFGGIAFFAPHDELLEQHLYKPLGCPMLSTLVEERQSVAGTVLQSSPVADQIKAQIMERTPLFIFEQRKTQRADIHRDADWLKKHLEVRGVEGKGLVRTRTFQLASIHNRHTQYTSALADWQNNRLRLYVSVSASQELDWFEVASALNRFLLHRQNLAEVLLYMTLLSSSLRDLKRRGFHVDRIIEQKEADKKAADQRLKDAQEVAAKEQLAEQKRLQEVQQMATKATGPESGPTGVGPPVPAGKPPLYGEKGAGSEAADREYEEASAAATAAAAAQGSKNLFSKFSSRFKQGNNDMSSLASGTSSISGISNNAHRPSPVAAAGRSGAGNPELSSSGTGPVPIKDMPAHSVGAVPTPLNNIKQSVMSAVNASRPDGSERIQSQVQKGKQIKEAESSYCDVGIAADLTKAGQIMGMNIYLSPEYTNPRQTLADNQGAIQRLIEHVYRPVGEGVFRLRPGVLNIFCDVEGPTIAFNREGTIFLNLRFYLAWHDKDVAARQPGDAIISVFHSLAHELAHNLVSGHNSEHEYYTSAISEQHFLRLGALLKQVGAL
ncbi:unnamed protein product [Tilletia controversa]|uniref:Sacsin/Nov domain-containing protein n=1 Tax=Tilletia controversa TaxID=13291 RepID=A0A8X7MRG0_9BASI|nr:hypothetical protein CF328_g2298 [Tilletia controversa]KAE8246739.1 hypothetical protein A4X06_0g4896 [Tilletia controversa]CAD6935683.1 unnamed protein product [Tilletia controversa]